MPSCRQSTPSLHVTRHQCTAELDFTGKMQYNTNTVCPVDYSMCGILQEKVYKTRITDLDELKQRLRTEWTKLDHIVIAAAIRQWRRR